MGKMKFLIILFFDFIASGVLFAQGLRGEVFGSDGEPLIGSSVYWAETNVGVSTDSIGRFSIHKVKGYSKLVASYLGYINDTLDLKKNNNNDYVRFLLQEQEVALNDIVIEGIQRGNLIKRDGIAKNELITFAGLTKMACCNLAESFEN